MTEQEEQLNALTEMRDLMNKSSRFISMSGLSGVAAGVVGLAGVVLVYFVLGDFFLHLPFQIKVILDATVRRGVEYGNRQAPVPTFGVVKDIVFIATVTLAGALAGAWYFTRRKAMKLKLPMWDATAKRMIINLMIPLVTGGGFAMVLLAHGIIGLVPAITLAFYGMALINASKYTLNDIRYLGLIEVGLSFAAAVFYEYSLVIWSIGFGLMHIIYGIVLYVKYEKKEA